MPDDKRRFYQFPLALLAYGTNNAAKLMAMQAYATIFAGKGAVEKMLSEEVASEVSSQKVESTEDFDCGDEDHIAWAFGKDILKVSWGESPKICISLYDRATEFLDSFGPSPFVRVHTELIRQCEIGEFPFRELSVLLAVYAVLGNKAYARIIRDRVRSGAMGYSSNRSIFDKAGSLSDEGKRALAVREDGAGPLTVDQIRYSLDLLHGRKFFSRLQPKKCGRTVYYSRSLSHDDLSAKLFAKMEKRSTANIAQQAAQTAFREKAGLLLKRGIIGETITSKPQSVPKSFPA